MTAVGNVTFSHPRIQPDLNISVNPDQVVWAYGLNTASFPTYGGEVVQILSVFWDDMTVSGTVGTTRELELIYMWFVRYAQDATQRGPDSRFDQQPVTFNYWERNWTFQIWPKSLPAFRYGRDVVAPTWTLTAAVKEPDATLSEQIKTLAAFNAAHKGDFDTFGKATADFGSTGDLENNPWASPDADPSRKNQSIQQYLASRVSHLGDTFNGFIQSYQTGQLTNLPQFQDVSKLAQTFEAGTTRTTKTKTPPRKKK